MIDRNPYQSWKADNIRDIFYKIYRLSGCINCDWTRASLLWSSQAQKIHQLSKSCCSDLRSYKRRANPAVHVRFGYPGYSAPTHEPHSPPCPGLCQTIHHRRTVFNILLEGTELSSYRDVLNVHTLTPEMSGTWVLIPDFLTLQMCSPWGTRIASTDAGREAR